MKDQEPKVNVVILKVVANVAVRLGRRDITCPVEAVSAAEGQVDLWRLLDRTRGLDGIVSAEYGDDVLGGLVDMQDDPDYEQSTWVEGESVTGNLAGPVEEALMTLIGSDGAPVDALLTLVQSRDRLLSITAAKAIIRHPRASREQARSAFGRLMDHSIAIALEVLEQSDVAQGRLSASDLAKALESDVREWRERAILLSGALALDAGPEARQAGRKP